MKMQLYIDQAMIIFQPSIKTLSKAFEKHGTIHQLRHGGLQVAARTSSN
jgi:hypothetical protein